MLLVSSAILLAVISLVLVNRGNTTETKDHQKDDLPGIRCPICKWRPSRSDMWMCECGEVWNTFETRGECPGCQKKWHKTQCTQCGSWSDHEDWYEKNQQRR